MPCLPRISLATHPHYQRIRETQPGDKASHARRTRVVRIFPNRQACLRLVRALVIERSEEWLTGRRYLNMEELKEHRREEQEVVTMEQ